MHVLEKLKKMKVIKGNFNFYNGEYATQIWYIFTILN